jgi:succinate dehydrogenase / fumarate reductase cytochrome b subunit
MLMTAPPLDRHFVLRKLHSLTGIIPIGAFLCFHLFENSLSVKGGEYFYNHVILTIDELPYIQLMEILFIAIPILFHALYGFWIWYSGKSNVSSYGYLRNWMYWVQRFSGLVAFAFIITHVWGTRLQVLLGNITKTELFDHLAGQLDRTWTIAWYVIGILASVIHFSNGLWLLTITWGLVIGRASQRRVSYACFAVGVVLLLLGAQALRGFINPAEIAAAAGEAAQSAH